MVSLIEGRFDKYQHKAVFLIGLPASGKTEFYEAELKRKYLKHMDSDKVMMFLIRKYGGDPKDTSNYTKWQKSVKEKLDNMSNMYTNEGLGLVIDGTGQNFSNIATIKKKLETLNYKTAMVYINTPLLKAIERAKTRERGVDLEYIKKVYKKLATNVPKYRVMFNPFIEVNSAEEFSKKGKEIKRWLNS